MNKLDFKAWHTTDKKWITEDVVLTSDVVYASCWDYRDTCESYNIEFVLFTGLRDKKGKKIYQGDFVQFSDWKPKEVIYEGGDGLAGFRLKGTDLFMMGFESHEYEVVGNKFEHLHLLKEE